MRKKRVEDKANEINKIPILSDRDYRWVWEYAQFRFNESVRHVNRAEKKGSRLLKFVIYGFGGFWALFIYFVKGCGLSLPNAFNHCVIAGLGCLCLAAIAGLYCLLPATKLRLYGEEIAIRFINENPTASPIPQGRFALGLTVCTEIQEEIAGRKSWSVLFGFTLLALSAGLLFSGFYSWLPVLQTYGH